MSEPTSIGPEAEDFVRGSKVTLIATRSPKARPFMTPLWFVVDRGVIYLPTGTQSWAGRNAAQHPDVTLMFGGERWMASGRMLRLRGRASCVPRPLPRRALIRIVAKYYLRPRSLLVELRHASRWRVRGRYHDGSGGPGYLTVTPTSAQFLSPP